MALKNALIMQNDNGTTTTAIQIDTAITSSNVPVVIDVTGNVGIGTSSPSAKLDVLGIASSIGLKVRGGGNSGVNILDIADVGGSGQVVVDASGNLLMGGTSKLSGGISGIDINRASGAVGLTLGINGSATGFFFSSGTSTIIETTSGNTISVVSGGSGGVVLSNGAAAWASLSDERKKDIIEPITNATTKVASLRAVIGKYKTDEESTRRSFLIAQDVDAVLPEAVDKTDPDNWALRYTEVVPLLTAALQELSAKVDTLQAELNTLKGN